MPTLCPRFSYTRYPENAISSFANLSRYGLLRSFASVFCEGSATKGRKKLILTCLPDKVEMYKKFGFKNHEIGDSVWGGEAWHKMDIVLDWWISHD